MAGPDDSTEAVRRSCAAGMDSLSDAELRWTLRQLRDMSRGKEFDGLVKQLLQRLPKRAGRPKTRLPPQSVRAARKIRRLFRDQLAANRIGLARAIRRALVDYAKRGRRPLRDVPRNEKLRVAQTAAIAYVQSWLEAADWLEADDDRTLTPSERKQVADLAHSLLPFALKKIRRKRRAP